MPLQGLESHTARQSVTAAIITIAALSRIIPIKRQASLFPIKALTLPHHRGSFYPTEDAKLIMRISSRETLFSTALPEMAGTEISPMWQSMPGTVIWWMHLLQRDMWDSVRFIPQERSSCAGDRHGYRNIQDHVAEEGGKR